MKEDEIENSCAAGCAACGGCGHDHGDDAFLPEGMSPIITLTDDEGKDIRFEIVDVVVLEDETEFLVVTEATEEQKDDVEVVILQIKEEDGEEVYDTVTDDVLAQKVFDTFMAQQDELDDSEE